MKKTIAIAGGTGLVGKSLSKELQAKGHEVRILTRKENVQPPFYHWNPAAKKIDEAALKNVQVIINLSGAGIADKKWTDKRKKEIEESRIFPTWFLYELSENLPALTQYISASGITCYGFDNSEKLFTEKDKFGKDYISQVVREWEKAADLFSSHQKVAKIRTGVVLTENGGALPKISKTVKYFVGAPLGTGKQIMPWISLKDIVNLYVYAVEKELDGAFNAVADNVSNAELTNAIAKQLHRPLWLPKVPKFALKLVLGELSTMVLEGVHVSNQKIKDTGFQFEHPNLESALEYIYEVEVEK